MSHDLFLIIDTETTSLFDFKKPADDPGQPRMASVSMLFMSADLLTIERDFSVLIKPDGWTIDPGAAAVNGLTQERLEAEGVPVGEALDVYVEAIKSGRVVAAFNVQFDAKVMCAELRRAGRDDMFMDTRNTCLMRPMTNVCKILKPNCRTDNDWKFPKLAEALAHIGAAHDGPHTSSGDALGAVEVLRYLVREDLLIPPGIHLAKKKPESAAANRSRPAKPAAVSAGDEIPE